MALWPPLPASADPSTDRLATAGKREAAEGSLAAFAARVAEALEERARAEGLAGPVRLEAAPSRGVDAARVERVFLPRLKRRLREGGVLVPLQDAPVACRVALSEERSAFWAVAVIEGASLASPSTVAVSAAVDRELEAALGAVVRPAQARFTLERLGAVPSGVLDAVLTDVDGDAAEELVLLHVDGVRVLQLGAARLEEVAGPIALPGDKPWPRVLAGWLARMDGQRVWAATSAGHAFVLDVVARRFDPAPAGLVPMRGASVEGAPLAAGWRASAPSVSTPLVTVAGSAVRAAGLPSRVRDIALSPAGAWIFIDEQGQLHGLRAGAPAVHVASERVGDRLLVLDLEGDGELEVITTAALAPGEGDHVVVRRLSRDLSLAGVAFRSPLSGGSIVALAAGQMEASGGVEIVLIEEAGREALAWRLRFSP